MLVSLSPLSVPYQLILTTTDVATNEEEWKDKIQEEKFEIPGTKVDSFKDNEGDEFVVYRVSTFQILLELY